MRHSSLTWVFLGLLASALLMFINDLFIFESILVPSSSMRPTLLPNERVFLKRVGNGEYRRFDVVVIKSIAIGHRIVKRIVALPGDCVQLRDSWRVLVDGKSISYDDFYDNAALKVEAKSHLVQLQVDPRYSFPTVFAKKPLCLASDEYFVLGDNRLASKDSRVIGPVKLSEIQGKMTRVWYSYDKSEHSLRKNRLWVKIQ